MNRTPIASPLLLVGRDATETWHGSDDEYREVGISPGIQRSLLAFLRTNGLQRGFCAARNQTLHDHLTRTRTSIAGTERMPP
jgi:hypothetical protein